LSISVLPIVRTALIGLRRDRAALALSFILPISFFSIFATIFGAAHDSTPKINVIVVDEDQSRASADLMRGLGREDSLVVHTRPSPKSKTAAPEPEYTAATAEAAVKAGNAPVALVIPKGFGQNPISFGGDSTAPEIQLLNDSSDQIAPQMVAGLLQKVGMTALGPAMAEKGMEYTDQYIGGFTPDQRKKIDASMDKWRQSEAESAASPSASGSTAGGASGFSGPVSVKSRAVVGQDKRSPMISFYAAGIGVMFLLFTASNSAGALLDEAEGGTLDRVLSSHVTMTTLLAGKLAFNTLLAFTQLTVMFLWAWAVFKLDLFTHIPGFLAMGLCSAFAVAAFGMLLASICHTRAQLGALSTLLILTMSAIGGSMFPRFLMPAAMQKAGLFTINGWAIDGFTKVFWRDLPVKDLWPQVGVLLAVGIVLFVIARRVARRWEFA
jgi:ABC-2 type transport system permease protein